MDWEEKEKEEEKDTKNPNTPEEEKFVHLIDTNQMNAETARGTGYSENGSYVYESGIDQIWEDEAKMFIGDQWDTSIAYRTKAVRKTRPNSVNNFIFSAVINTLANITSSDPEVTIEGVEEGDREIAEKLTFMSRFNDQRNKFPALWKKMVLPFVAYGPMCAAVLWDSDWIGGTGPNRWVGDVRIVNIDRRTIYFDPAIIDLEDRLQECSFIHLKVRKKLEYLKERWPERGKYVQEDLNDSELQDEGQDPKQVWLIAARHRGLPKFVPDKRKKELLVKAEQAEMMGDTFKAQEYRDMAEGKLKGVHLAYVANGVFLEYIPYEYDDGEYPIVYKVCYFDENTPYGFGEIRNTKVPQILHNKADEIEIEAMSREGLGGKLFNEGAVTPKQLETILKNSGKGGAWLAVNNVNQLADRDGVKTPQALIAYKEHKQRMVETVSQNTPIQQGISPGTHVPYSTVAELGARTDIRTKIKVKTLVDFLTELNRMRINRFVQFYTEDRYFRIRGEDGKIVQGSFNAKEAYRTWDRQVQDEQGNITGVQQELFVPEFDISVKIMDEKPKDRTYYTRTAVELFGQNGIDIESLWYTLEEGKFPPTSEIIKRLTAQNSALQVADQVSKMPPELQQIFFEAQNQLLQNLSQPMGGEQEGQPAEGAQQ